VGDDNMKYGEISFGAEADSVPDLEVGGGRSAPSGLGEFTSSARQQSKSVDYFEEDDLSADPSDPQVFGRMFVNSLFKILKIGSIYQVDHNQTRQAIGEFIEFFQRAMAHTEERELSIVVRDELGIVNGENLRLKRKSQQRLNELRDIFADANIKGLLLSRDMTVDDLVVFLTELREATKKHTGMEHVEIPTIEIDHGQPVRNLIEKIMNVDKAMYVLHVYIRGLVKMRNMHEQVRERQDADIPTGVIRRIMQSISELLADEDYTILGLLPLRLVPPDLSSHSLNTAVYAMLLGDRLALSPQVTSFLAMSIIYQDLDRIVGISVAKRDRETGLDAERQFSVNLRDVARMLGRVRGDVISTLRVLTTYERGCPYERKIANPFYRRPRDLHLASRIIDLCRTYDLLIQGLEGYKTRRPDLAIEYVQARSGEVFDSALVDLLVSTLGVYPIGTTVQLTSGETAVVIKTPDASKDPRRPVVRTLNTHQPHVIDLSAPNYGHIEIARSVEVDPAEITVSKVFLLS
jgi:HD-GYP domain-containing protein (c-di-GMP phosphodiesterase class II)